MDLPKKVGRITWPKRQTPILGNNEQITVKNNYIIIWKHYQHHGWLWLYVLGHQLEKQSR